MTGFEHGIIHIITFSPTLGGRSWVLGGLERDSNWQDQRDKPLPLPLPQGEQIRVERGWAEGLHRQRRQLLVESLHRELRWVYLRYCFAKSNSVNDNSLQYMPRKARQHNTTCPKQWNIGYLMWDSNPDTHILGTKAIPRHPSWLGGLTHTLYNIQSNMVLRYFSLR